MRNYPPLFLITLKMQTFSFVIYRFQFPRYFPISESRGPEQEIYRSWCRIEEFGLNITVDIQCAAWVTGWFSCLIHWSGKTLVSAGSSINLYSKHWSEQANCCRMSWLKWCCSMNDIEMKLINKEKKYLWAYYTAYFYLIWWVLKH